MLYHFTIHSFLISFGISSIVIILNFVDFRNIVNKMCFLSQFANFCFYYIVTLSNSSYSTLNLIKEHFKIWFSDQILNIPLKNLFNNFFKGFTRARSRWNFVWSQVDSESTSPYKIDKNSESTSSSGLYRVLISVETCLE